VRTLVVMATLWFSAGGAAPSCKAASEPPLRAADGLFDLSNRKTLGLEVLDGRHVELFRAGEHDRYRFSHHPGLAVFRGKLYCSWSSGFAHEDRPGQRVVYTYSADGIRWSPLRVLAQPDGERDRCIAAGFHVTGGAIVAYFTLCREYPVHNLYHPENALFARTSSDGLHWSKPQRVTSGFFIEAPRQLSGGRLLLCGEWVGERWKTHRARMRLLYSDDPDGLVGWKESSIDPTRTEPNGTRIFGYTEPCPYVRADGVVVSPFRNSSGFLYASLSQDNGVSWTVPSKTNFPDSRARCCTGRLPDGTVYLINNPGPGEDRRAALGDRSLLTIALSRDGVVFDRAGLLRGEPTVRRFRGKEKVDGWQYPNAVVWQDALYVVYSVNKEDIVLTRIPLKNLGARRDE